MWKSTSSVCLVGLLVILAAGCGSAGDKLAKDEIDIIKQMAAVYGKVNSKSGMESAKTEIVALNDKLAKIEEEFGKLGSAGASARKKLEVQRDQALEQLGTAKMAAGKAALASK